MSEADFWSTEPEAPKKDAGSFDGGGGDFEVIPAKTQLLVVPEEVKFDESEYVEGEFINVKWNILAPDEYKGRKVFHKIKINLEDKKKAEKARKMFYAIDHNAGGELAALKRKPTDSELAKHLVNKQMVIMVQVYKMKQDDGTFNEGNWVSSVSPKTGEPLKKPAPEKTAPDNIGGDSIGDDVPW